MKLEPCFTLKYHATNTQAHLQWQCLKFRGNKQDTQGFEGAGETAPHLQSLSPCSHKLSGVSCSKRKLLWIVLCISTCHLVPSALWNRLWPQIFMAVSFTCFTVLWEKFAFICVEGKKGLTPNQGAS